jgi:hypothetical protein
MVTLRMGTSLAGRGCERLRRVFEISGDALFCRFVPIVHSNAFSDRATQPKLTM